MLGCDGQPPTGFWRENLITGTPLTECPMRTLRRVRAATPALAEELDRYLALYYPLYEDGHLLEEGGVAAQPARYLELIAEIRHYRALAQAKYEELTKPTDDARHDDGR